MEVLLFADEDGEPINTLVICHECRELIDYDVSRFGEDDHLYCPWCYDSTGQDPGAL